MSYDELPPDERPLQSEDADVTPTAQDPSSQDAPPAAPTRRRRTRNAGSDAASDTDTTSTAKPARSTRRRTDLTPAEPSVAPPTPDGETAGEGHPAPEATEPKTTRRRRTPRADTPLASAEGSSPVELDTGGVAPPTAPAPEAPPRASRRTRRAPATQPTAAEAPASSSQDAPSDPVVAPEPQSNQTAEQPKRRRNRRAAAETSPQVESVPPPTDAAIPPVTAEAGATEAEAADTQAEPTDAQPKARGRQRNQRSRRQPATAASEPEAHLNAAGTAGVVEPPVTAEGSATVTPLEPDPFAPETAEAPDATDPLSPASGSAQETFEKRKRGNRRNRSNRRGGKEIATAEEVATEVAEAVIAAPAPAEPVEPPVDLSVGTHLAVRNALPTLLINGVPYPPVLFFGNLEGMKNRQRVLSEVRRAAHAGVHLHSTLVELPCPLSESGEALDEIDSRLRAILEADPDGYVMPRVVFLPARGWKREYPTEISAYADGTPGDPSLTSARFWQECERSLQALIAHIRSQIWGERVFGYHLERGEWFQPADPGFDRSMANRDAFRDWLREKYQHDLVGLRAAWYDGDVQFHTAEIPTLPAKPNPQRAFYEPRRERSLIDFNEFTSETTARRLIALARTVKKATDNNALVSVCYGYTFEFGHGFSGHLALDLLLADKTIDLICGPPSYRDRKPGGAASLPSPVDSMPLHGKLWLSEDDTKTYLAPTQQDPEDFNPRLGDRLQTEQAQLRALGRALTNDTALGWMDLWGEGWLDEDAMWDRIGSFTARLQAQREHAPGSRAQTPEVIALIDEKSLLHIQKGEPFFRRLTNGLRDTLQRVGVTYATYLQSDLLRPDFPTGAKLYLFLTPYRLSAELRATIKEKLQGNGRTLAWLYAPATCEARPSPSGLLEETATGATGLILRQQAWNSEIGSRIVVTNHVLTERLGGRDLGTRERLNPSFYVDDPGATVLAEYQGSGLASLAVKDHGTWRSVFVGDPVLPLELLRGICRYAGVHLWTAGGEDVVAVGNGWVMVHAGRDGQRTLRLPAPTAVYDVTERRLIADEVRDYRYFLRAGNTRLFYCGTLETMRLLELPNLPAVGSARERIVLADPISLDRAEQAERAELVQASALLAEIEPAIDTPPVPVISPVLNTDLETLKAVLAMEMPDTEEFDLPEEQDDLEITLTNIDVVPASATLAQVLGAEVGGNGRRRRRRGGRGRGRRRENSADPTVGEAGDSPPPAEPGLAPLSESAPVPDAPDYDDDDVE